MPDATDVGRFLMIGFDGTSVPPETRDLIATEKIAGVILFKRNVESAEQLCDLVGELRAIRTEPLVVAVDHEGGRVARVNEPFTALPPFRRLGEIGDESLARSWAHLVADELLAVGIDLDFAPVMDVDTNPANPVIGDRALSSDPGEVARLGSAVIGGFAERGLLSCAKHFPGHGDTELDSHLDLPRVAHDLERIEAVELPPFAAAIEAGVDSLMTAHVVYDALDPGVPATLSPGIVTGIVRDRWGYDGVVFSDDLEMRAIADRYGAGESAVLAVRAGCDLLLACHRADRQREMLDHLRKSALNGFIPPERIAAGVLRVEALMLAAACRTPDWREAKTVLGRAGHRALAETLKETGA